MQYSGLYSHQRYRSQLEGKLEYLAPNHVSPAPLGWPRRHWWGRQTEGRNNAFWWMRLLGSDLRYWDCVSVRFSDRADQWFRTQNFRNSLILYRQLVRYGIWHCCATPTEIEMPWSGESSITAVKSHGNCRYEDGKKGERTEEFNCPLACSS